MAAALQELEGESTDGSRDGLSQAALVRSDNAEAVTRVGQVHLLQHLDGVPDFEALHAESELREIDGVRFRVASVASLKLMKEAAGRGKDLIDLNELDLLGED